MFDMNNNWLEIVIGAVAAMALGFLWYSPVLFGKQWMKLSGISVKDIEESKKKGMNKTYFLSTIAAVLMAYVLNVVLNVFHPVNILHTLIITFMLWLGFVATTMITTVLFDNKPFKLFLINSGYQLASLLVMGVVFSLVR